MNKLERLGSLYLTFLNNPGGISFSRLREKMAGAYEGDFDSARRKFERDKEDLKKLGLELQCFGPGSILPHGKLAQDYEYIPSEEPDRLPELKLENDEAALLATILLENIESIGINNIRKSELLKSAAKKLLYKNPPGTGISSAGAAPRDEPETSDGEAEILGLVVQAIKNRMTLRFQYPSPSGDLKFREVYGRGIITHRDRWCLVAHDARAGEIRYFYLNRMIEPEIKTEEFPPDPSFQIQDHSLHPLALRISSPVLITVILDETREDLFFDFLTGAPPSTNVFVEGNRIELTTTNPDALFSWILLNPGIIKALGPEQIREEFEHKLNKMKDYCKII